MLSTILPLISVIIPIYNAEKYLKKCLDSVLTQTYLNIEIILINDGSEDGSKTIIDAYARQDERIQVIHYAQNRGVSYARNRGIDVSKGEYTIFVDADDYIEKNMLEKLYENLQKNQADINICGVDLIGFSEKKNSPINNFPWKISSDQCILYIFDMLPFSYVTWIWNKLICNTLVKKFYFSEDIYRGEDLLFMYQLLKHAKCVSYIPEKMYHYVYHKESSSHKGFSEKQYTGLLVYKFLYEDALKLYPSLVSKIEQKILVINISFAVETIESPIICRTRKYSYLKNFQKNIRHFTSWNTLLLIESKSMLLKIFLLYGNTKIFWLVTIIYNFFKGFWLRYRKDN